MKTTAVAVLALAGVLLLLYPLWGVLSPDSYALELTEHHAHAEGYELSQVRSSAAMLWISNGALALGLLGIAGFLLAPDKLLRLRVAGLCLILYPFLRTLVEVLVGLNLTSHTEDPQASIEFSSEKLFFVVFGLALLGLASVWNRHRAAGESA